MSVRLPASLADRIVLGTVLAVLVVYGADYLALRAKGQPLGSVTVHRMYVMALKNQKMQFTSAGDESRACVHAIFPHFGNNPCWYLERHTEEQISM